MHQCAARVERQSLADIREGLRCLLVEDEALLAELLCSMLRASAALMSAHIAKSVQQAKRMISRNPPDILVLDLDLPDGDGQDVALHLISSHQNPSIIILSAKLNDFICDPRLLPFIHSVVDKTSAYKELAHAIGDACSIHRERVEPEGIQAKCRIMSAREQEVFLLIGKGKSSREICSILNIGLSTVESHRKAIAQCLGTSGADLVRIAAIHCFKAEHGLIEELVQSD
jgi:two-component system response regulator DesR